MATQYHPYNTEPIPPSKCYLLAIPKKIRLKIYEFAAVSVIHHYIMTTEDGYAFKPEPEPEQHYALKILNERISGLPLLCTCRTINSEAVVMRNKVQSLSTSPIRLIVPWNRMSDSAMLAVLQCAAKCIQCCDGNAEIGMFLMMRPDRQLHLNGRLLTLSQDALPQDKVDALCRKLRAPPSTQCGWASHDEIHALVARDKLHRAPKLEIAVNCSRSATKDICLWFQAPSTALYLQWFEINRNMRILPFNNPGSELDVVLRPMPVDDEVAIIVHNVESRITKMVIEVAFQRTRWKCETGGWVDKDEFESAWAEGERL